MFVAIDFGITNTDVAVNQNGEDILITGGYWSTYYYDGFIYGTEITRGLDVFTLTPSEYISEKEIEAASSAFPAVGDSVFNPQQQFPMAWPATFLE